MQTETLILNSTLDPAGQDQQAVAAVRNGDAQRYRELVERHERRVYAVAWSRLGDAALAEEATQEAFIRAYRHLGLLGDGAKFSAWIGTIVRNAAISLGMRQRRELDKRARWALEQPVATGPVESTAEETGTAETLRQALADLPAAHRECLVLFYLEGKSGAEAATALGISEAALRVRLHRARAALRERMEERLGESLEQLRPAHTMVPSVMAAVLSGSTAKVGGGVGFGATLAAAFAKVLPFKVATVVFPAAFMLPSVWLSWLMHRAENRNYLEAEGFRAKLHRGIFRGRIWYFVAFMAAMMLVMHWVNRWFGLKEVLLAMGLVSLPFILLSARILTINRSRYHVRILGCSLITAIGIVTVGLGWLPMGAFPYLIVLSLALAAFTAGSHPMRMDYNLFLRATQGLLANPAGSKKAGETAPPMGRAEVLAFARFLGERYWAMNYRWADDGLMLCLPGVAKGPLLYGWTTAAYFRWSKRSWILLGWDGVVRAHCGRQDEEALRALGGAQAIPGPELEARVAAGVEEAWGLFRKGEADLAERGLGQVPEAEVFRVPQARSNVTRWRVWIWVVVIIVMIVLKVLSITHEAPKGKATMAVPTPVSTAPTH
ncbi:MAG: RNA polymerase sigma factor [Opitutales bacterium]|jgi:RNA polymerase sigma-70 factor (ECF subfamily)